jgi:hypothetical protein
MGFGRYRFRRSFGNVASQFRGARPSTYPLFSGLLDQYPNAAAAYSLRALSSGWLAGDVVEVRRSSDSTTDTFTANQITGGEMLSFVNADLITYSSDFSVNTDGTTASGSTLTANQSVGGEDDALLVTVNSGTSTHEVRKAGLNTQGYSLSFEYYIPSSNTDVDGIEVSDSGIPAFITEASPTLDQWNTASSTTTVIGNAFRFRLLKAGAGSFTGNGTDVFYVKNIVITQTTADGFVSTWYDQSGNGNDATQATTTAQPKIVSAGALVTGGLDFDGVGDYLQTATFSSESQPLTKIAVTNFSALGNTRYVIDGSSVNRGAMGTSATPSWRLFAGTVDDYATGPSTATDYLMFGLINGASSELFINSSSLGVKSVGTSVLDRVTIGINPANLGNGQMDGTIAEIIVYPTDQSANRVAIEANINAAYTIY